MSKKKMINVSVLVQDSPGVTMARLVPKLREKGFVLKESLNDIGVILGSVGEDALNSLSTIEGVAAVEPDRTDYETQN
ncbi:MAG: hypothetical protein JNL67_18695 [Planctomycetaceae bacterium]|nr:hypothetical protein [Planctomycetaceae bacterium]